MPLLETVLQSEENEPKLVAFKCKRPKKCFDGTLPCIVVVEEGASEPDTCPYKWCSDVKRTKWERIDAP